MKKRKLVLVTGGAGYIGSVLVRMLLTRGYAVRVLDSMRWGGESLIGLDLFDPSFEVLKGDICDPKTLEAALPGVDAVVHLAAIVGDPACKKEPELAKAVNLDASTALFDLARHKGVQRFIFASTCSNYGKMADPEGFIDEQSPLKPVSLYAELKVAFEKHVLGSPRHPVFKPVVLRFATVYGVSPRMRFDLTVNEFVRDVFFQKELVVFGERFWRPYCHVVDLALSCILALEAPEGKIDHEVFNVGDSGENYQKQMLVDEIRKTIPALKVSFVTKQEDPRDYRVNFSKIHNQLGFQVTRRVPDGIREINRVLSMQLLGDPYDKKFQNT